MKSLAALKPISCCLACRIWAMKERKSDDPFTRETPEADLSVYKVTLFCTGLYSATCEFTSQSKMICPLLLMFWNPAYFGVVAFLLQGHGEQSTVVTHYLVVFELICWNWSAVSSYSLLADTCCSFCSREVFKPDQTITGIYWNEIFFP